MTDAEQREAARQFVNRWMGKGKEVVGCIAGDDTIMCAIRTVEDTAVVMENIRKLVSRKA